MISLKVNMRLQLNKKLIIGLSALFLGLIIAVGWYIFQLKSTISLQEQKLLALNSLSAETIKELDQAKAGKRHRIIPNADKSLAVLITFNPINGYCELSMLNLLHSDSYGVDVPGLKEVSCSYGPSGVTSDQIYGWLGLHKIAFKLVENELTIIDFDEFDGPFRSSTKLQIPSHYYDVPLPKNYPENQLIFAEKKSDNSVSSSNMYQVSLYRIGSDEISADQVDLLSVQELEADKLSIHYDSVNTGYFIVARNYDSTDRDTQMASSSYYFWDSSSYEFKLLVSSEPMEVMGRGCFSSFIEKSEPGVIYYNHGGCDTLPESFFDENGLVKLGL